MRFQYIIKRILVMIPVFIGITVLCYFLATLIPGDPAEMMLAGMDNVSDAEIERLRAAYGLNQPVYIQYLKWLWQLLHGNFGTSYRTGEAVLSMIMKRLVPTLSITLTTIVISVLIAVPLGMLSAMKPCSIWDYLASGIAFLGMSTPTFFLGLVLVYIFAVKLGILPTGGMYTNSSIKSIGDTIQHMILPVSVLVFSHIGSLIRQARGSVLEVLQEDYIRTARGKGLKKSRIMLRHTLRNALIPIITSVGLSLPFLIGGAVVTEQIFSWPGIGSLMLQSISTRDYPCIMGITVFIAIAILLGNLLIDILYGIADPRISYKNAKRG